MSSWGEREIIKELREENRRLKENLSLACQVMSNGRCVIDLPKSIYYLRVERGQIKPDKGHN